MAIFTMVLIAMPYNAWGQASNVFPPKVDAAKAMITKVGHATMAVRKEVRIDSLTLCADTVCVVDTVMWNTEVGTARKLMAKPRRVPANGTDFYHGDNSSWRDIYWFSFAYPSLNSKGEICTLSSLACMPDDDCDKINNVVIGCHATITAQIECPTAMKYKSLKQTNDTDFLMDHASSGWVFHSSESDAPYYNLVIIPDYEGYGLSVNVPHPYLSEEVTARQVVDAVRYGIELYKSSPLVADIRHPFRDEWRSFSVGYSQGGGTAMAVHRFIEQNNLVDELHFTGSICGAGPYNPIATMMEYINQAENDKTLNMVIVMPLILKGMCDSNPYMRNHKVSDYLSKKFLDTGIIEWLDKKQLSHDDIKDEWDDLIDDGKDGDKNYYKDVLKKGGKGYLKKILTEGGYNYFKHFYDTEEPAYKDRYFFYDNNSGLSYNYFFDVYELERPTIRGLFEDLHKALSYNDLTKGWNPEHPLYLYHSYLDDAVPVQNRTSAKHYFGNWVKQLNPSEHLDHVLTAMEFLLGTEEFDAVRELAKAEIHPSKQILGVAEPVYKGTVRIDGKDVVAEFVVRDGKAILGSGYNACISQYLHGVVEVPGTITIDGKEYKVVGINDMAFRMCSYITYVTLPEGLTRIGEFAFYGCNGLLGVDLPSSLTTIGTGAFIDLPKLNAILLRAQTPPTWEYNDVFCFHDEGIGDKKEYTTNDIVLYVPEGRTLAYKEAVFSNSDLGWVKPCGWDYFTNIMSIVDYNPEAYAVYDNGTLTFYYDGRRTLQKGRSYHLNEGETLPGWTDWTGGDGYTSSSDPEDHAKDIKKVVFSPSFFYARPTSTYGWFAGCVNLTDIEGWENLNTSEVTHMNFMFSDCRQLTNEDLDLSNFDTQKVNFFSFMFQGCTSLTTIDLGSIDTSAAEWLNDIFSGCTNLTSLDLSKFNTKAASHFEMMFYNCSSLKEINLSNFEISSSATTGHMFEGCSSLKKLSVPTGITKVYSMFEGCVSMEHVYYYGTKPFNVWGKERHLSFAPNETTQFHVLKGTANAWKEAFQNEEDGENWRANCTFVDDLGIDGQEIPIYITADWVNLQNMLEMGFTNLTVKLMRDISITTSLGTIEKPFSGTFDGNGHTIDASIVNYEKLVGVFSDVNGATIKNLHVTGYVIGRVCTGGMIGATHGDGNMIENCRMSAYVGSFANSTNGPHAGGFIGHGLANTNTIRGCFFDGRLGVSEDENLHDSYAGVFIGWCSDPTKQKVENCMEKGSYDAHFRHLGLNFDASGNAASVPMTNCYHRQSWAEGKRAYSITCRSDEIKLDFGTPYVSYDVSGIDMYDNGFIQDSIFYAVHDKDVTASIVTKEGYDFNFNNLSADGGYVWSSTMNFMNFHVSPNNSDVVINVDASLKTFYIYDDEKNSQRLSDILGEYGGYDVCLKGRVLRKDGAWNTLCLPFEVKDIIGTPLEGASVKTLQKVKLENNTLTLYFGEDLTALEAGMPYIVRWTKPENYVAYDGSNLEETSDLVNPSFPGVTVILSKPGYAWFAYDDDDTKDVGFKGLFNPMAMSEDHTLLYLGSDNMLYHPNGDMQINACRAYFILNGLSTDNTESGINNFVLNFDNGLTSISSTMGEGNDCDGAWYAIDGRKLYAKPKAKGVYIYKGKKVLVK